VAKVCWHQVHKLMKLSISQETLPAAVGFSATGASHGCLLTIGKIIAQMHAVHVETQLQLKP